MGKNGGATLPEPGQRNILVTSALPYVNNVPHLGNIIGSILSWDVFARYCRGRGINTLYIGGTDEYGTTTEARALLEKCTPQELCDKYHVTHAEIYRLLKLIQNGFLKERITTQFYCQEHHSFLADRFVEGECPCGYMDARGDQCDLCGKFLDTVELKNPRCKIDRSTPITRDTKHVFLELDNLQSQIKTFFQESSENGAWSSNGEHITSAWLKEVLQPRSIARDMECGTEVPSASRNSKVQLNRFIGKDNVVYHSVIFPGSQIGTGENWTKLHHLSTTDYLTYEGGKFSKSRGIGVFGDSVQKTGVPADVWRCFLLSHRPETSDTEFTWDSFISCNNSVLLKNFGNFVNRVLKFTNSQHYNNVLFQLGKLFLQSNKLDNSLAMNEPSKRGTVVGLAINLIHLLASVVAPYMPETANAINRQLRIDLLPIPDL
ncbi:hypothetical protein K458DRAFT_476467 [Lentithecium fluviatile CBS 122367]|uniref:methionine--tRNA ligase n=1 Tax=Lentithecium fluviatile CBS 122367 TaxID=1168545 RepID=A0A6G1J7Y0_9PLEO|nr:hypothetical protein K458DRAFT_476467 [Lentithecium fluviatile CBS 122367]